MFEHIGKSYSMFYHILSSRFSSLSKHTLFSEKRCLACYAPFEPKFSTSHFHYQDIWPYLCPSCLIELGHIPTKRCTLCGHTLPDTLEIKSSCLHCQKNVPPWESLSYFAHYESLLKTLILQYKYTSNFSLIPLLSHCLFTAQRYMQIHEYSPECMIVPMPRHKKRLGSQGFNQILELCRPLSKKLATPLHIHALERCSYRAPQVTLKAEKRRQNPAQSFWAHPEVIQKNIILVDDVMTTGATLHHATLALKVAKAKSVHILLIAKVEQDSNMTV